MMDETRKSLTPTYFANVVTMNMSVDEMIIELRQVHQEHKQLFQGQKPEDIGTVTWTKPPAPDEMLSIEPVARVVLTFTAAKNLKRYLDDVLPKMESARRLPNE